MNVMNPEASELMLSSLKNFATQSRPVVTDKGEILVIEGNELGEITDFPYGDVR